jgi:hypothetical protein
MDVKERRPTVENQPSANGVQGPTTGAEVSRRRALIAGLAAAPVILTLIRRPVWAQSRTASPGICASLAAASSLHNEDAQLKEDCKAILYPTSTTNNQ